MKKINLILVLILLAASAFGQREQPSVPSDTGGPLMFEQAVYDVQKYDISVDVDPKTRSISGRTIMTAKIVIPTDVIVLDLDTPFTVAKVDDDNGRDLKFAREGNRIRIWFPMTKQTGYEIKTAVTYSGTPRVAPNPPWVGGFVWTKTPGGADWISIACQNDGADIWFPVKDHPSDKASAVTVRATVPEPLVAASVGKFEQVITNLNGTATYIWNMTNPISNYEIILDIGPFEKLEDSVKSITGETIPIEFYILPEDREKGARLIAETKKYNAFFEKYLGPFPFRSQKLGIVQTPHLGMEHSTLIAYGNKFRFDEDGLDWLMFHEFGHEWWANLVTASDWRDFWIHEGFQSFMDTFYLEKIRGKEAYLTAMKGRAKATLNLQPVAPREPMIASRVYLLGPDYKRSNGDIYGKGAVVLHTLRYLIGDDAFFRSLRRMAYPTKEMETFTDGRQTRFVTTDDFLTIAERESGMELDWFFELYLRQPTLPKLVSEVLRSDTSGDRLELHWETPDNMPFPMPVDVVVNGKTQRVEMKDAKAVVEFRGNEPGIDPDGWVLKAQ